MYMSLEAHCIPEFVRHYTKVKIKTRIWQVHTPSSIVLFC